MRLTTLFIALLLVALAAPAAAAELPRIPDAVLLSALQDGGGTPEAWGGIWDMSITIRECESGFIFFQDTSTDTICAGESIEVGDEEQNYSCTWEIDGNSVTGQCEYTEEVEPGCTQTTVGDYSATVSGSSYTATFTANITYAGDCNPEIYVDTCFRTEITGTKTAPQPASCVTPALPSRWGGIKALYR